MPYAKLSDLPGAVQNLPEHAQEIFRAAFNHAWQEYSRASKRRAGDSREMTVNRVAWAAVKRQYEKSGNKWVKKNSR